MMLLKRKSQELHSFLALVEKPFALVETSSVYTTQTMAKKVMIQKQKQHSSLMSI
jgi:hypothetical protein